MTPKEFVNAFYTEKQDTLNTYFSENKETEVKQLIQSLHLTPQQTEIMKNILDVSFTDLLYTILLGLDGCNPIGHLKQQQYTILDENTNQICGSEQLGEIEALAYEYFQEHR